MNIFNLFWTQTWFSEDRISTLSAVLFAALGLLSAVIGYEASRTGDLAEVWSGRATQQTMQIASTLAVGRFDADYSWGQAFRLWLETDTMGAAAYRAEDPLLTNAYDSTRDNLTTLSPMLRPPYFDSAVDGAPNLRLYEADLYLVKLTRLQQEFELTQMKADFWGEVSGDYWLLIKILSTALVLLGIMISLIEEKRIQYGMWALVVLIGVYCTVQTALISQRLLPTRSAEAMDKLAAGYGLYYQGRYDEAIVLFDEVIALEPDYVEAHVQRGFAYRNSYTFDLMPEKLAAATADFEMAVANGRTELDVVGQLSELYYLKAQYADSIRVSQTGWDSTGDFFHAFTLGRGYAASGDFEAARTAYADGIVAAREVYTSAREAGIEPSASLWRFLDIAMLELEGLERCAAERFCDQTPVYKDLVNPEELAVFAADESAHLKSLAVELEFGLVPDPNSKVTISPLRFASDPTYQGESDVFYDGVSGIQASFDYNEMPEDSVIVVKVFVDNAEFPPLRHIATLDQSGQGTYTFEINPGLERGVHYIDVFINGAFVGQSSFTIITKGK